MKVQLIKIVKEAVMAKTSTESKIIEDLMIVKKVGNTLVQIRIKGKSFLIISKGKHQFKMIIITIIELNKIDHQVVMI